MSESYLATLTDPETTVGDLLDVLSNERRRAVLSFLRTTDDDAVALAELVEQVSSCEDPVTSRDEQVTTSGADDGSDDRETVATALHHVHLPKLSDAGLLDYDAGSNTVHFERHPDREHRVALAVELMGHFS